MGDLLAVVQPILLYFFNTLALTIKILVGSFMPIIFACIILNFLAKEQIHRLFQIGGWNAVVATSWIGTPVHELSHYLAAVITNHKVTDLKLFVPDKRTGQLGYMNHRFQNDSFYQATIGNALISIAPFFGGSLAIYLLTNFLFPDFSLFSEAVPKIQFFSLDKIAAPKNLSVFFQSHVDFFRYLAHTFFSHEMVCSWKLYVFLFIMFSIANNLAPSRSDFNNFWAPLAFFLFGVFLLNLAIYPLLKHPEQLMNALSGLLLLFMPILYLAIFVSALYLLITYIVFGIFSLFRLV